MESSSPSDCEVRAVIKFLNAEGVAWLEIHRKLSDVYGSGNIISFHHVYEWIKSFNTVGWHAWEAMNWLSTRLDQWWNNYLCAHSTHERLLVRNFRHSLWDGKALPNADLPHNNLSHFNWRTGNEESECSMGTVHADREPLLKLYGGRIRDAYTL